MENIEALYDNQLKKISKYTLFRNIFGILAVFCLVVFVISTFFRTEKTAVSFDVAEKGDYTTIEVISLEKYKTSNDYVYFYYTDEDENDGTLRLSTKDAQSEVLLPIINKEENNSPVRLYGTIREENAQGSFGGNNFNLKTEIVYAGLSPEMKATAVEMIFSTLGQISCILTFVAAVWNSQAKRKLKILSSSTH